MRFPSQGVARHNAYDTCVAAERVERIGAGILRQAARGLAVKYGHPEFAVESPE